jgi:hypothetical protein
LLCATEGGTIAGRLRKQGGAWELKREEGRRRQEAERRRVLARGEGSEAGGCHWRFPGLPSYWKSWELLQEAMCDVTSNRDEEATNRKLTGSSLVVSTSPFLPVRLLVTARVTFVRSEALPLFFSIILLTGGRPRGSGESCSRGALLLPMPLTCPPSLYLQGSFLLFLLHPKGCVPSPVHWAALRFLFQ